MDSYLATNHYKIHQNKINNQFALALPFFPSFSFTSYAIHDRINFDDFHPLIVPVEDFTRYIDVINVDDRQSCEPVIIAASRKRGYLGID